MAWYHSPGMEQDAVISSCVRLARNLEGRPFPSRLDAAGAKEILSLIGGVLEKNGFTKTDFADISRTMAYALVEQQYVTPAFIKESLPHALYLNEPCHLSAMVCGEDHIHLQCMLAGLALQDAYAAASKVEQILDKQFSLAFDPRLGYLTQSLVGLGTAMELSVTLCLPMLAKEKRIEGMAAQISHMGLSLRGLYGDGSGAAGGLYRLTHPATVGLSEEDALTKTEKAVQKLIEEERKLRDAVSGNERERIIDRVMRAEGILRYAYSLSTEEFLELLSDLRLGVAMNIIRDVPMETLTALLIEAMPATLTLAATSPLSNDSERNKYRAVTVKEKLK